MSGWTTDERWERCALMLIEVLSKPNTHLSSDTAERLRRILTNGARGNLHLVSTLSVGTENVSMTSRSARVALTELDSMKDCILSGWDVSTELTLSDTLCHGGLMERRLTMRASTTNDDGPSESKRVQCVECPACNEAGRCLGTYRSDSGKAC